MRFTNTGYVRYGVGFGEFIERDSHGAAFTGGQVCVSGWEDWRTKQDRGGQ